MALKDSKTMLLQTKLGARPQVIQYLGMMKKAIKAQKAKGSVDTSRNDERKTPRQASTAPQTPPAPASASNQHLQDEQAKPSRGGKEAKQTTSQGERLGVEPLCILFASCLFASCLLSIFFNLLASPCCPSNVSPHSLKLILSCALRRLCVTSPIAH